MLRMRLTCMAFGEVVHQPVKYDLFCREPPLLCSLARAIACLGGNRLSYICLPVKGSFSNFQGDLFNSAVVGKKTSFPIILHNFKQFHVANRVKESFFSVCVCLCVLNLA